MKSGFKSKIGNVFCLLSMLLIVVFYGCRTSKNSVVKEKIEIKKSELLIDKFDSVSKIDKFNKIDHSFQSKQTDFKQKLDISFNGLTNDDEFEFKFTENGFIAKGKGYVNQKSETNKKDSVTDNKVNEIHKENSTILKNGTVQTKSEENQSKIDKDKQSQSRGFNWNFTILLIAIGVVALILLWKFGLPKFRK